MNIATDALRRAADDIQAVASVLALAKPTLDLFHAETVLDNAEAGLRSVRAAIASYKSDQALAQLRAEMK